MSITQNLLEGIVQDHKLLGFNDLDWNLGQIIAWAASRNPFAVDSLSTSKLPDLTTRHHSISPGDPQSAVEYGTRCANQFGYTQFRPAFDGDEQLYAAVWRAFRSGAIEGLGKRRERDFFLPLETIKSSSWIDLIIGPTVGGDIAVIGRDHENAHVVWHDIRAERSAVLEAFGFGDVIQAPETGGLPISNTNDPGNMPMITAAHQDNASLNPENIYRAWIAQNESENKIPKRDDCLAHMRKTFPDIDVHFVRKELRNKLAPPTWTAKGRRPNKSA